MKKVLFIVFTLSYSISIHAQFHTIEPSNSRYAVKRVIENEKTAGKGNGAAMDDVLTHTPDTSDVRQKWIDQYLSVSYPLNSIHITSPYGKRNDPFNGKRANHNGLDLRANNEDVFAMLYGKVEKVGNDKRSGVYVTLRHGDYTVSFCHLSTALVKKGGLVQPGQPIAISGNTGRSTAPHLHITLKKGHKTLNPTILLDYVQTVRREVVEALSQ